jgi:hypothetical protein
MPSSNRNLHAGAPGQPLYTIAKKPAAKKIRMRSCVSSDSDVDDLDFDNEGELDFDDEGDAEMGSDEGASAKSD